MARPDFQPERLKVISLGQRPRNRVTNRFKALKGRDTRDMARAFCPVFHERDAHATMRLASAVRAMGVFDNANQMRQSSADLGFEWFVRI